MGLRVAVVIPPMTNLNTPYASAPRLTGWLRQLGHEVTQIDLSLEVFLRCYSRAGLARVFAAIDPGRVPAEHAQVYADRERYVGAIDELVAFLQGKSPSVSYRILNPSFLPRGPQTTAASLPRLDEQFGPSGITDRARFVGGAALKDLALLFGATVSPGFELASYAAQLALSASSFDDIARRLGQAPDPIEELLCEAAEEHLADDLDLVAITCPFPGNVMGAFRLGSWLRTRRPRVAIALGGGYPSTELRDVSDPRVFDWIDYLVLDDGEVPLRQICERREGREVPLSSTFTRRDGRVEWHAPIEDSPRFRDLPTPDYAGLALGRYIDTVERFGIVNRMASEGRWLKLTAAHGCYWKRCTFCDIHLSYIGDFDPVPAATLVDQMDAMHAQTGLTGFHFTDEAAPPPLLANVALELLRRQRSYHFWGNIRFDPGFTPERCRLLAAAGMIAVTGGLEVANDRLLKVINKGVTIAQATRVCAAFARAGIAVHAYLMHAFPGETLQDTVDALEVVRQLIAAGVLHSAAFHKFIATAHSPIGRTPEQFGIRITGPSPGGFARYAFRHEHAGSGEWPARRWAPEALKLNTEARLRVEKVDEGLNQALEAYLEGRSLHTEVGACFGDTVLRTTVPPDQIASILAELASDP